MSVKFQVQMNETYMYDFMKYHNYTSTSGIINVVAGLLCLATFVVKISKGDIQASIWLICAIVFLVVDPYSIKTRAKKQVNHTEMFQKPLEYEVTSEGVIVRQEDQEVLSTWDTFTKAVTTGKSVLLYMGRVRAIILPKECIGEQYEELVKMLYQYMPMKKVRVK